MDRLQNIALKYQDILHKQYYFEIARKQKKLNFILSFEKSDFYHIAGLHKLTDIAILHGEPNKQKIYENILSGYVPYNQIKKSRFYKNIESRLSMLEDMEKILDSNQIIFKYIKSENRYSRIEADFLLENAHRMNVIFMFLSDRNIKQDIPIMCCRSFFIMDRVDYTRKQPSYTLLKKVKIDIRTGEKNIQYDRNKIMEKAKQSLSEHERKSVLQQLNEKKAQHAINDVLHRKRELEPKKRTDPERF